MPIRYVLVLLLSPLGVPQEKEGPPDPAHFVLVRTIADHGGEILRVRFSKSGKRLVSAGNDGIRVWDLATKAVTRVIPNATYFELHPNEDQLAYTDPSKGNVIHVYNFDSGKETCLIQTDTGTAGSFHYLPDGHAIVVLSGKIGLWNTSNGKKGPEFFKDIGMADRFFMGRDFAVFTSASALRIVSLSTGKMTREIPTKGSVEQVAIDASGKWVAWSNGPNVSVWDTLKGKVAYEFKIGDGTLTALAFQPGGKFIAGAAQQKVALWALQEKEAKEVLSFEPHRPRTLDLTFSPDGKTLASSGSDRRILFWDGATGAEAGDLGIPYELSSCGIGFDGKCVYGGDSRGGLRVWDLETGLVQKSVQAHAKGILSIVSSPDGKRVVTTGMDGAIQVWDTTEWKSIRKIGGFSEYEGRPFVTATDFFWLSRFKVRRWGLESGDGTDVAENANGGGILSFAVSGDGKRVAVSDARALSLWDAEAVKALKSSPFTNNAIANRLAMSADGALLALPTSETMVLLVKSDDFTQLGLLSWTVEKKDQPFTANLAFSPDGRHLAGASASRAVIWSLEKRQVVRTLLAEGGPGQRLRFVLWLPDSSGLLLLTDQGQILVFAKKK